MKCEGKKILRGLQVNAREVDALRPRSPVNPPRPVSVSPLGCPPRFSPEKTECVSGIVTLVSLRSHNKRTFPSNDLSITPALPSLAAHTRRRETTHSSQRAPKPLGCQRGSFGFTSGCGQDLHPDQDQGPSRTPGFI